MLSGGCARARPHMKEVHMAVPATSTIPRTFKGIYQMQLASGATCSNPTVMLSADDTCAFCADATANSSGVIGTLPADIRPSSIIVVPVGVNDGHENIGEIIIGTDGTVSVRTLALSLTSSGSGSYDEETGDVSVSTSVDGYPYMTSGAGATAHLNGIVYSLVGNSYNWENAQGTGGDDAG